MIRKIICRCEGAHFFALLCLVTVWEASEFAARVSRGRTWMWHRVASVVMGSRFDTAHSASCLPRHMVSSDVLMILMLSLPHFSLPRASFIKDTEPVLHLWLYKELTLDFSHMPLSFCFCLLAFSQSFFEGQSAPWDSAKKDENRMKNRYGNIIACAY